MSRQSGLMRNTISGLYGCPDVNSLCNFAITEKQILPPLNTQAYLSAARTLTLRERTVPRSLLQLLLQIQLLQS